MSEIVKAAERKLQSAKKRLEKSKQSVEEATEALVEAESQVLFSCHSCGWYAPYKEQTLVHSYYTERGLGYEDDRDVFSENQIECCKCGINHRFLSQEALDRFKVPYEVKCHYGRPVQRQTTNREFNKKFKKVVERIDERGYKFINLYK